MTITAQTKLYAVLGHPIRHSLSPAMHNAAFAALKMDAIYVAFDVPPARLMRALPVMAELGFVGVNLTVPLKEVAFRGLRQLDESARLLGSVNTVRITPRGLKGYSTDGAGFLAALREDFRLSPKGRSVFILGCGGAGRAVAIACARAGVSALALGNRTEERARTLAAEIRTLAPRAAIEALPTEPAAWIRAARKADLVVHASSLGVHGENKSLLGPGAFRKGQHVVDLLYARPLTPFLKAARKSGARTANGLSMLLHQGALSFEIWTGVKPPVAHMRRALQHAVYGRV